MMIFKEKVKRTRQNIKIGIKATESNIVGTKNGKLLVTAGIQSPVVILPVMIALKRNIVVFISSRLGSRRCRFTSRNHSNARDRRDNQIYKVGTVAVSP